MGSSASTHAGPVTSARNGHPLALAAGELAGPMREPMAEPDLLEHRGGAAAYFLLRRAPDGERHRDVLERRELGQQMVELVDEAERLVAQPSLRRLA